jgi:hypothetical protein
MLLVLSIETVNVIEGYNHIDYYLYVLKTFIYFDVKFQSHVADICYFKSPMKKYVENSKGILECLFLSAGPNVINIYRRKFIAKKYEYICGFSRNS